MKNDIERGRAIVESGVYRPPNGELVTAVTNSDVSDELCNALRSFEGGELSTAVDSSTNGELVLDDIERWFARFIRVTTPGDLCLLALWTVHTHLAVELYTSPRLQVDSTMPSSGKTTVLDHLSRLCKRPVQVANLSSPALLPRLLENGIRTILLDEVDRQLRPDKPGVQDLIGIFNSGYRVGATRPVLVPTKGGGWEASEMSTFSPVGMAGNSPQLADDTQSRCIRILLMPDLDGSVEDSDWELIEDDARQLGDRIAAFADEVRDQVKGMVVDLPAGCIGRAKEKWRPLKRVAVAAGGRWPALADQLIAGGLAEDDAEREAGLRTLPPGMVLLTDLHRVWPSGESFVPTADLVTRLIAHNPDYWGASSGYGKQLTEKRFGTLLRQATKVTSQRPGGRGPRGFNLVDVEPVWTRLHITHTPPGASGASGDSGASGARPGETHADNRMHRVNHVHRIEPDTPGLMVSTTEFTACTDCDTALTAPESRSLGVCRECALGADQ